jgi:multidrug resistance protein, MATE family
MSSNTFRGTIDNQLTKYPVASFRELLVLSFPLVLSTLSASLLGLCDRYFLSHYSLEALKASSTAANLCFFYQMSFIMIAMTAQAFIGHFQGSNKKHHIGPLIWQMIYFSFLSMAITYPLSLLTEFYLKGTEIQAPATLYFHYLALSNFLFPLGGTLSSFYIGRGKTRIILLVNILTQVINIGLDYLLIFGIKGWFAPMGIKGAAIATIIAQASLCLILFIMFLQKKYSALYRTDLKKFNRTLFWEVLKIGIPRAFGRSMVVGSWILASYLLVRRGGDFLLVHTFGVSLFLIFSFLNEGMAQALVTVTSHILGAKLENLYKKLLNTSFLFLAATMGVLAIPLLFMQNTLIHLFIHTTLCPTSLALLKECCLWIWVISFASGINRIGTSLLTATRDTVFYAGWVSITWITLCIPVFVGIGYFGWSPTKFFLLDGINCIILGLIFIFRFLKEPFKKIDLPPIRIYEDHSSEQVLTTD